MLLPLLQEISHLLDRLRQQMNVQGQRSCLAGILFIWDASRAGLSASKFVRHVDDP
jgi:hypothetical protein